MSRGRFTRSMRDDAPPHQGIQQRVTVMNLMADLGPDEREVLAVFERFGQEGRAISTESLAVHAGLKADRKRFSAALQTLAGKGFIKEAGGNPFSNAPLAYRRA